MLRVYQNFKFLDQKSYLEQGCMLSCLTRKVMKESCYPL